MALYFLNIKEATGAFLVILNKEYIGRFTDFF